MQKLHAASGKILFFTACSAGPPHTQTHARAQLSSASGSTHTEGGPPQYKYHLAPDGLKVGDVLMAGADAPIKAGSTMKLKDIPMDMHIHNIELVRACMV